MNRGKSNIPRVEEIGLDRNPFALTEGESVSCGYGVPRILGVGPYFRGRLEIKELNTFGGELEIFSCPDARCIDPRLTPIQSFDLSFDLQGIAALQIYVERQIEQAVQARQLMGPGVIGNVDDHEVLLSRMQPRAAPEHLGVKQLRFRRPRHDYSIDARFIKTLGQHITVRNYIDLSC